MVTCSGRKVAKYILYVCNILLLPFGLAAIVFGIYILAGKTCLLISLKNVVAVGSILIVGGVAVLAGIIIGFWGALKESPKILRLILVPIVIIFCSLAAFWFLFYYARKPEYTKERLENTLNNYVSSNEDKEFWENLQRNYKCCGIDNYSDWQSKGISLPESCCHKHPSDEALDENESCKSFGNDLSYVHKNGCYQNLVHAQTWFYRKTLYVTSAFFICELTVIGAAYWIIYNMMQKFVFF